MILGKQVVNFFLTFRSITTCAMTRCLMNGSHISGIDIVFRYFVFFRCIAWHIHLLDLVHLLKIYNLDIVPFVMAQISQDDNPNMHRYTFLIYE